MLAMLLSFVLSCSILLGPEVLYILWTLSQGCEQIMPVHAQAQSIPEATHTGWTPFLQLAGATKNHEASTGLGSGERMVAMGFYSAR